MPFTGEIDLEATPSDSALVFAFHQGRLLCLQRLELIEHGVNYNRPDEDQKHLNRQDRQPEIKPPAPGTPADHSLHDPQDYRQNQRIYALGLSKIREP